MNDWKSTSKQIEQYRPIVKKTIAAVINDIIADRLNVAIKNENTQQGEDTCNAQVDPVAEIEPQDDNLPEGIVYAEKERGVVTTQEEIDGYNIIRSILRRKIKADKIVYKDFKSYFAIGVGNASYWWGCRLAFGSRKKNIYFPTEGYKSQEKVKIETLDDIFKYADRLEQTFDMAQKSYENYKSKH